MNRQLLEAPLICKILVISNVLKGVANNLLMIKEPH